MWRKKITDLMADVLRFTVRGAFLIDAIILSLSSIYITARFCIHLVDWMDRTVFGNPW